MLTNLILLKLRFLLFVLMNFLSFTSPLKFTKSLLVATTQDVASINMVQSLSSRPVWTEIVPQRIWRSSTLFGGHVFLWMQEQPLLAMNHVDELFRSEVNEKVDEVVFLSKHKAASGILSLTVHPIGIPWISNPEGCGGLPGRCSPPSFRIGAIYRELLATVKERDMQGKYQVTLEATHHGPHVDVPACFVEIGSKEEDWCNKEAGDLWADILVDHFQMKVLEDGITGPSDDGVAAASVAAPVVGSTCPQVVVVMIGGGHYVPKMNDAARLGESVFVAHALTTYALEGHLDGSEPNPVPGGWERIITETIESTKCTFQREMVVCMVDKKAFKSEHRNNIVALLDAIGVKWTYKFGDIKSLLVNP